MSGHDWYVAHPRHCVNNVAVVAVGGGSCSDLVRQEGMGRLAAQKVQGIGVVLAGGPLLSDYVKMHAKDLLPSHNSCSLQLGGGWLRSRHDRMARMPGSNLASRWRGGRQ